MNLLKIKIPCDKYFSCIGNLVDIKIGKIND